MNETTRPPSTPGGILVWLKGLAALTILVLAIFAILFIFNFISAELFKFTVLRVLLSAGVLAAAGAALAVLLGRSARR